MNKFLLLGATLLTPGFAWAHAGHGGVGLFHHLVDFAPAIALMVVVAAGVFWTSNRNK